MADSDSLENPDLLVSCHASSKPMAGSSFEDVASNKRPCRSFSARILLLIGFLYLFYRGGIRFFPFPYEYQVPSCGFLISLLSRIFAFDIQPTFVIL